MTKCFWVYIIANKSRTTLYIGMTNDLERRMLEHREGRIQGFSERYNTKYLMYCEEFDVITKAIEREKQLKKWKRAWKDELITSENPLWQDISAAWFE